MPGHDIIVVGASAGGVETLKQLVRGLPADLPAALFIVLHLPPHGPSVLPRILERAGRLRALHPLDGQPIEPGRLYVAPPDQHLIVKHGFLRLTRGPRENGHRPSVDTLFRTAARSYGPRVIGVVLSGALDDGTAGLIAVKAAGGLAVVQDPNDARYGGMPRSALENVLVDHCVPVAALPDLLVRLVAEPAPEPTPLPQGLELEADLAEFDPVHLHAEERPGTPSVYGCPDCGGTLWELQDSGLLRYRCRVGHAWSAENLLARKSEALEAALWTALRALEEQAALARRLGERARSRGFRDAAGRFGEQEAVVRTHAETLRDVLLRQGPRELPRADAVDPESAAG